MVAAGVRTGDMRLLAIGGTYERTVALGSGGWSGGGGVPKGLVHNPLMQFFTLGSSKIEVLETCFLDIVTT